MSVCVHLRGNKPCPSSESSVTETGGQSLVELAISLPLLLLLLLGTIDMGRVFFDYIEMRQAAVEGATYGSRRPTDTTGIEAAMVAHGMPAGASIAINAAAACTIAGASGDITVTASRVWKPVAFDVLEAVAGGGTWTFTVNASSTMRCMT